MEKISKGVIIIAQSYKGYNVHYGNGKKTFFFKNLNTKKEALKVFEEQKKKHPRTMYHKAVA